MSDHLRSSAASLRLLASHYAGNADYTDDRRASRAWTIAELRLLDAIEALEHAADDIDGTWEEAA